MSMDTTKSAPPGAEAPDDDLLEGSHTATFGFFDKYRKLILYSAGLFALVSFSVTGALLGFFDWVVKPSRPGPTMTVAGETIQVTEEDREVAMRLNRALYSPVPVFPAGLIDGDDAEVIAALRRLAIHAGIEPSMTEVDKAIETTVKAFNLDSAADLPSPPGRRRTVGELRATVAEAMRVATYMRLQLLSVDTTDQVAINNILDDGENITLRVATLDKKAIEEGLEAGLDEEGTVLRAWIDELDELQLRANGFLDTNRVSMKAVALPFEGFDPLKFSAELEGLEIPPTQIDSVAARLRAEAEAKEREANGGKDGDKEDGTGGAEDPAPEIPRIPGGGSVGEGPQDPQPGAVPPETQPQDPQPQDAQPQDPQPQDPQPQDPQAPTTGEQDPYKVQARAQLEVEAVLNQMWQKVRDARQEYLKEAFDALAQASQDRTSAETVLREASAALEADAENEELKQAVADAEADVEAKKLAAEAASDALDAKRVEFDVFQAFKDVAGPEKEGLFLYEPVDGPKNTEALKDLGRLGTWRDSWAATQISVPGELSSLVARTDKVAFHFQVTELELSPRLPFEDIQEKAREAYLRTKADEQAKEKREAFEAALLELAKAAMGDKLTEINDSREGRITEQLDAWRQEFENQKASAEAEIARLTAAGMDPQARAMAAANTRLEDAKIALADEVGRRAEIEAEVDQAIEAEIAEEAEKYHHEVMAAAAEQSGWAIDEVGPFRKGASNDPWFRREASDREKFLAGITGFIKKDESTGIREDFANRALYMAVCTNVDPVSIDELRRRDFMRAAQFMRPANLFGQAARQAFSLDALRLRYGWKESRPDDSERVAPAN